MNYLLDTHLLLWAAGQPDRLSREAYDMLSSEEHELLFSTASLWEIAIKSGLQRADFQVDVRLLYRGLMDNGYSELPIKGSHAVGVGDLPMIHRDPFDRLLVSQAIYEGYYVADIRYPGSAVPRADSVSLVHRLSAVCRHPCRLFSNSR